MEISPQCREVLRQFARRIDLAEIGSIAPFSGFSGAQVWKIATPNHAWALRRWPENALPAARIRGLHRLLAHLRQSELEFVASPLTSDAGETLVVSGEQLWQLESWLPGTADFHADPNRSRLEAALTALALWHRAAATFSPMANERSWFGSDSDFSPAVSERLQKLRQLSSASFQAFNREILRASPDELHRLCGEMSQRIPVLAPSITAELTALQVERFALQPCLRDIWHDHLLFSGDQLTGLIDASACRTENVATDLARLVGSLVEDDSAERQFALDVYRRHRPLSLAEEALFTALDRSGVLLSAVTWLEWLFREHRSFPSAEAVLARVRHLHRRVYKLAEQIKK